MPHITRLGGVSDAADIRDDQPAVKPGAPALAAPDGTDRSRFSDPRLTAPPDRVGIRRDDEGTVETPGGAVILDPVNGEPIGPVVEGAEGAEGGERGERGEQEDGQDVRAAEDQGDGSAGDAGADQPDDEDQGDGTAEGDGTEAGDDEPPKRPARSASKAEWVAYVARTEGEDPQDIDSAYTRDQLIELYGG